MIERQHQTLKNGLKAALVDMGNTHRDKWFTALPWVLLGKRVQYQPHMDASASQMVLGKSVTLPGMLLGEPGPPLNQAQTRVLLDELYKMAARPPVPTSSPVIHNNIEETLQATSVYVKAANPLSLCPKFDGPYPIVSRPSRSTIKVRIGSFANGQPRHLTLHWSSCKVANQRPGALLGSRPKLGRPSNKPATIANPNDQGSADSKTLSTGETNKRQDRTRKPEQSLGPVIPGDLYEDLHPEVSQNFNQPVQRPIRQTRNPNPNYT